MLVLLRRVQNKCQNGAPKLEVPTEVPSESLWAALGGPRGSLGPREGPRQVKVIKNENIGASLGASVGTPSFGAPF